MIKFTQAVRFVLTATMIAGLSGCGEEKQAPPPPPPQPAPPTVGGSVSGLAGGEVVLQLNGADDLTVKANGKFKFPKPLGSGNYAVTVLTNPSLPVKQTCTVSQGEGSMAGKPVNNVAINCVTNSYAIGGSVKGLAGKGLVLELKGVKEVTIAKNGNFLFPDTSLPDGSDYSVAIKKTPAGQRCEIESVSTAPESGTINIVAVTCKKRR